MWIRPAILGAQPSGRAGCASATVGDMCLFIGGADRSPRAFDEVWILKNGSRLPRRGVWRLAMGQEEHHRAGRRDASRADGRDCDRGGT